MRLYCSQWPWCDCIAECAAHRFESPAVEQTEKHAYPEVEHSEPVAYDDEIGVTTTTEDVW